MSIVVCDPTGSLAAEAITLAARPQALKGLTVGLMENTKEQAELMLDHLSAVLAARGARIVRTSKPSFSRVAPREIIEELAACGAVVTALGG